MAERSYHCGEYHLANVKGGGTLVAQWTVVWL